MLEDLKKDRWMWMVINKFTLASQHQDKAKVENETKLVMLCEDEVKISKLEDILSCMKDWCYNVSIGDILQVVWRTHHGLIGLVKDVDIQTAEVQLISEANTCVVSSGLLFSWDLLIALIITQMIIPIPLYIRFSQFSFLLSCVIGHTVWIIHG